MAVLQLLNPPLECKVMLSEQETLKNNQTTPTLRSLNQHRHVRKSWCSWGGASCSFCEIFSFPWNFESHTYLKKKKAAK